jgi:dihydrofolate reductase
MVKFSVVVAMGEDASIGYFNRSTNKYDIPWDCKVDMKFFRELTSTNLDGNVPENQNIVIMGKNTYFSLPRNILPNRINIVVSASHELWKDRCHPSVIVVPNFEKALEFCNNHTLHNVYVIGGSKLYKEALGHNSLDSIYVSIIPNHYFRENVIPNIFFPLSLEQMDRFTQKSLFYKKSFLKVYKFK